MFSEEAVQTYYRIINNAYDWSDEMQQRKMFNHLIAYS
jgi:hypothetical protein